jgi:hypothetical protein
MYEEILKGIGLGAFYGAQAGLYGYLASEELPISWRVLLTRKFWETFSWTKFGKTVLLGAIVGAVSTGYLNITPDMWTRFTDYTGMPQIPLSLILNFANTAVIMGVDKLAKFVVRRTPLVKAWNGLKDRVLKLLLTRDKLNEIISEATKTPSST